MCSRRRGTSPPSSPRRFRSTPFFPPADYWQRVRRACDRHGTLLILDEIPHGLGRSGKLFTCQHYDVVPDILVLGKGLGGGIFPLAAIAARAELDVASAHSIGHYTHEKSPVACAAALATLDVIEAESLVENAREIGAYALAELRKLQDLDPRVGEVRGLGLLLGVSLVKDRSSREPHPDLADAVLYEALRRGLSFKVTQGHVLALSPPLNVGRTEIAEAVGILRACLEAC